jgi:membrane protease YdiL (CAAX protease family)
MRDVRDGSNPALHERYWEGQVVAAARGSLHWGFLAFFAGFGSYYLVSLVFGAVLSNQLSPFDAVHPPKLGPLLLLTFAPNVLLGLAPAVFSWWKGHGLRSDFGILPTLRDLRVGLACGGVALISALVLTFVLTKIRGNDGSTTPLQTLSALSGGKTVWLALVAIFMFIGAPLTEELLVRGALWGALEHYRVPRFAILALTALIFAFLHGEPARTLVLFVQGIALGVARMITGRIGSSMVAHATNNLLPAVAFYFLPA